VCVQETKPADLPEFLAQNSLGAQVVDPPQWCEDANGIILGTRTQICLVTGLTYTTTRTVNGTTTVTGEADMVVISYSYSDTGLPTFAHQLELSMYSGWGDAQNADRRPSFHSICWTRKSPTTTCRATRPPYRLQNMTDLPDTVGKQAQDVLATVPDGHHGQDYGRSVKHGGRGRVCSASMAWSVLRLCTTLNHRNVFERMRSLPCALVTWRSNTPR
jgi:hypothetical protein